MQAMKKMLKTMGIMIVGVCMGGILLTLAFLIPVNEGNRSASYDLIGSEGWYPALPRVSASYDTFFYSYMPGVLDGGTDRLMLETAMEPTETNALRAAMDMNEYEYYWHGYVAVLRPLLFFFDYGEIRVLNGMGQLLLVFFLGLILWRKKGVQYALLELTSYFLLMAMAMPFALQYTWVFYIAMGSTLYLVSGSNDKKEIKGIKLYWAFLLTGMLTSFFDLLTYPLYTWGIPIIWWLLLQEPAQEWLYYVKQVVYTGLWWILGYAGMWAGKSCLGSLVLGRDIFAKALGAVLHRSGTGEEQLGFTERLEAAYWNWKHYEYKVFVLVLAIWLLYFVIRALRNGVAMQPQGKALALAGISSVAWYFVLANHTREHHCFTYRIYSVAVLAVLAILLCSVRAGEWQGMKKSLRLFGVFGCLGIMACVLPFFAREDVTVINGDREFRRVEIQEGKLCEMSFSPSFPFIKSLGICMDTDAREGVCKIVILDGEKTMYEEEIPLNAYDDVTYAFIPVDWKLKKQKEYRMCLSVENADAEAALLVTCNQDMPLSEYGEVQVGGTVYDGQILSGVTYSYRPLSHFTLAFLAMTWMGILSAGYAIFFAVPESRT